MQSQTAASIKLHVCSSPRPSTVKPVLSGHARATSYSGLYREVVFEYKSKYITQIPLGHHGVAS